jgi:FecR-like protein
MIRPRFALPLSVLMIAAWLPVSGQAVISTHSGVLYFFEGSVSLGGQPLEQKFGKFPDLGEGRELRTGQGRAEVLLTPGVILRIGDNSAIRMVSQQLTDTRVELLCGSAILEVNQTAPDTAVTLMYKQWQVRSPQAGVYRFDSDPAQVRVYRGQAEVSTSGKTETMVVRDGENLPLAAVLVPEPTTSFPADGFKAWAMNRSQEVSADNAIASGIVDDPSQMTGSFDSLAGFNYFPMTGIPSLGIVNPYGVSFWSPYQSTLNSMYYPSYLYTPMYLGWPNRAITYPRPAMFPLRVGTTGLRPGVIAPRPPLIAPRPAVVRPIAPPPHVVVGRH